MIKGRKAQIETSLERGDVDVDIVVSATLYPETMASWEHPGDPAEVDGLSVVRKDNGEEFKITDKEQDYLEELLWESVSFEDDYETPDDAYYPWPEEENSPY